MLSPDAVRLVNEIYRQKRPVSDAMRRAPRLDIQDTILKHRGESWILCSRRAGKTWTIAFSIIDFLESQRRQLGLYVGITWDQIKDTIWKTLLEVSTDYQISIEPNAQDHTIRHVRTGSYVRFIGAEDIRTIERRRGPSYYHVWIDEAASLRHNLEYLILNVAEPALADLQGSFWVCGTPGGVLDGMFYERTKQFSYGSTYEPVSIDSHNRLYAHWDMGSNSFCPHFSDWRESIRKKNNWLPDTPQFIREYFGLWIRDTENKVCPFFEYNYFDDVPDLGSGWRYLATLDLGYVDPTAWLVGAVHPQSEQLWIVEEGKQAGMTVTDLEHLSQRLYAAYNLERFAWDCGGSGALNIVEELRVRRGMEIESVQKGPRRQQLIQLADDARRGRIRLRRGGYLAAEAEQAIWDIERKDIHKSCEDHALDAARYLWQLADNWLPRAEPPPDVEDDWGKQQKRKVLEQLRAQHIQQLIESGEYG